MKDTKYKTNRIAMKANALSNAQAAALEKLTELATSSPLAVWQMGHGFITSRMNVKVVKAILKSHGITADNDLAKKTSGEVADVLNQAFQGKLFTPVNGMAGNDKTKDKATLSVRGFASGNVLMGIANTPAGYVLAKCMSDTIKQGAEELKGGKIPVGLLVPTLKQDEKEAGTFGHMGVVWKVDFRLGQAALSELGVSVKGLNSVTMAELFLTMVTTPENVTPIDAALEVAKEADKAKAQETIAAKDASDKAQRKARGKAAKAA